MSTSSSDKDYVSGSSVSPGVSSRVSVAPSGTLHTAGAAAPVASAVIEAGLKVGTSGSITTREEWYSFVSAQQVEKPWMPSEREIRGFSEEQMAAFDSERVRYHFSLPPVEVPAMERIREQLLPLIKGNLLRTIPGARRGGIVDGPGGVGKTTNIVQLGRKYERMMRHTYPNPFTSKGVEYIPVVYVTLPAETTIKGLNTALARFYGLVFSSRATKDEIGHSVIDHAERCATSLIIVDDIHFLDLRSKDGRVVNDHLKYLANQINATFVYAGIECEANGLLNEGRSASDARFSQTQRRFGLYRVKPFSLATAESTEEWKMFLRTVESRLVLRKAQAGMLSEKLSQYIFDRTDGYIGAVSELVARGTFTAIQSGEEKITKAALSGIALDYASQQSGNRRIGSKSQKKRGKPERTAAYAPPHTQSSDPVIGRVTRPASPVPSSNGARKPAPASDIAVPLSKPIKTA